MGKKKASQQLINIQAVLDDLNEIQEAVWEMDILFPEDEKIRDQWSRIMKMLTEKEQKWKEIMA